MEKLKYDIVHQTYDEATGLTTMKINSPYGSFDATATCHQEDNELKSKRTGWYFCEYKCVMKLWKAKYKAYKERANEDMSLLKQLPLGEPGGPRDLMWKSYANNDARARYCRKKFQAMKDGYSSFTAQTLSTKKYILDKYIRSEESTSIE